jgi:glycosyltransferase involved in cell wall biosynthesis
MKLVSVVMANYNGDRFLRPAVESVLMQTYEDFEFIIVDDGSSDQSRSIISEYARLDNRIKLVRREHGGLVAALNLGCELAEGDIIARLDSDDIAESDRLKLQVDYLEVNPDVALVGGWIQCIDDRGDAMFTMEWPTREAGLRDYLLLDCHISHTTVMFRKCIVQLVGGYRKTYQDAEDYDLFLRLSDHYALDNLPHVLCRYRLHGAQVSAQQASQQIVSGIGARLATRARRNNQPEPLWSGETVSREDLIAAGVTVARVDSMIQEYAESTDYKQGWRWKKKPFVTKV